MIKAVQIEVIPHKDQSYNTAGDYRKHGSTLIISVSDTGNWLYNMAIAIHEFVEAVIYLKRGGKIKDVDTFDIAFEKKRVDGNKDEPGDEPDAPYHVEHGYASAVERLLIAATGESWKKYDEACKKL